MVERADVVVIGLGAMGSAAARSLGMRGVETIALERFRVGHARGSSHGPTRIFRLSYPDPEYVRMAGRALELWRELERQSSEDLVVTTGGIDAGPLARPCADALAECGIRNEWLSSEECTSRFQGISGDGFDDVLFHPDAGVCLADRAVAAQAGLAREAGVDLREDAEAVGLRPRDDGVAVDTPSGSIEAKVAVVTAGAWVRHLLPDVPVEATVQTVAYFRPFDPTSPWPTFIEWGERGFAWYEVPAAAAAPGVKVGEHHPGPRVEPADGPFAPDPKAVVAIADQVRRRFPG